MLIKRFNYKLNNCLTHHPRSRKDSYKNYLHMFEGFSINFLILNNYNIYEYHA